MQEGRGDSLAANVAPDLGDLLLLLHAGHVVTGHHRPIDDGGGGQGEGGLGVAASQGLVRVASILVRIPLALVLVNSILLCNLHREYFFKIRAYNSSY